MNITVDTNFLISATQWDNSVSKKFLMGVIDSSVQIFTTKDILEEFAEVLERDFEYPKEESKRSYLGMLKHGNGYKLKLILNL